MKKSIAAIENRSAFWRSNRKELYRFANGNYISGNAFTSGEISRSLSPIKNFGALSAAKL